MIINKGNEISVPNEMFINTDGVFTTVLDAPFIFGTALYTATHISAVDFDGTPAPSTLDREPYSDL